MTGACRILLLAALALLAACEPDEAAVKPAPEEITRAAIGHYCNMIVADHHGPKAQIFLKDRDEPIWFSSVRDAIAFTLLPEEPKNIAAIYVNDMAVANWAVPQEGSWIEAAEAFYVIGSERRGGMGALEAVPLGSRGRAEAFAAAHGGQVVSLAEIPRHYILGDGEETAEGGHGHGAAEMPDGHGMEQEAKEPDHDS